MSINPLPNISGPYIQSLIANSISGSANKLSSSGVDPSSLILPQDGSPQLSPFARILSTLQQLQTSDPTKYQQVTAQIATNLQSAAQTATSDGNTSLASQLNQLSTDFTNASQNNTLPNVQDLATAVAGAHGHHHHHHMHAPSSSSDSGSSTDTTASDPSIANPTPANSTQAGGLSQIISSFLVNSLSSAQNSSLDPLSIISSTLSSAGVA